MKSTLIVLAHMRRQKLNTKFKSKGKSTKSAEKPSEAKKAERKRNHAIKL